MTIDTNILIAYFDQEETVVSNLNTWWEEGRTLILPATVEAELLSFPAYTKQEVTTIQSFLDENFIFVPIDKNITRKAAEIRRTKRIKLPDATIAATALVTHTFLITRNIKDFKNIPNLFTLQI